MLPSPPAPPRRKARKAVYRAAARRLNEKKQRQGAELQSIATAGLETTTETTVATTKTTRNYDPSRPPDSYGPFPKNSVSSRTLFWVQKVCWAIPPATGSGRGELLALQKALATLPNGSTRENKYGKLIGKWTEEWEEERKLRMDAGWTEVVDRVTDIRKVGGLEWAVQCDSLVEKLATEGKASGVRKLREWARENKGLEQKGVKEGFIGTVRKKRLSVGSAKETWEDWVKAACRYLQQRRALVLREEEEEGKEVNEAGEDRGATMEEDTYTNAGADTGVAAGEISIIRLSRLRSGRERKDVHRG